MRARDGREKTFTKSVMHIVYSTRMSRNLKKLAGWCARPAIQYVLKGSHQRSAFLSGVQAKKIDAPHMVDTTMVGIMRRGTTSKTRRTNNQAVGLTKTKKNRRVNDDKGQVQQPNDGPVIRV